MYCRPYFAVGMYVCMYVCDVNVVKFKECNCKSVGQCMMSCFSTLIVLGTTILIDSGSGGSGGGGWWW